MVKYGIKPAYKGGAVGILSTGNSFKRIIQYLLDENTYTRFFYQQQNTEEPFNISMTV